MLESWPPATSMSVPQARGKAEGSRRRSPSGLAHSRVALGAEDTRAVPHSRRGHRVARVLRPDSCRGQGSQDHDSDASESRKTIPLSMPVGVSPDSHAASADAFAAVTRRYARH